MIKLCTTRCMFTIDFAMYVACVIILLSLNVGPANSVAVKQKPSVIIIMADDLGWNDLSFHGSNQILTPNIDALAYNGIILNRYYVPSMCTPSRAAMMTGKYPIHTGMHHFVIPSDEPWGLSPDEKIMPQYFREAGYRTHLIGKWHLGFHKKEYTPNRRGFDSFFGYYAGYIGYYDHSLEMIGKGYARGYDMRKNESVSYDTQGVYATNMFSNAAVDVIDKHDDEAEPLFMMINHLAPHTGNEDNPLEAPARKIKEFAYIQQPERRTLGAMISILDDTVGDIVNALDRKGMLNNSIVLFYTDNGAPSLGIHANSGSNYPLRGQKDSPWEGGIRSAGAIWSPLLKRQQRVSNQLMYVTDWLSTFAHVAGYNVTDNVDSYNLWSTLSLDKSSERTEIVHNIDEIFGYSAYMAGENWKYVNGSRLDGVYDGWLGEIDEENTRVHNDQDYVAVVKNSTVFRTLEKYRKYGEPDIRRLRSRATVKCALAKPKYLNSVFKCFPLKSPCLFHLRSDPCEQINLANVRPIRMSLMTNAIERYRRTVVPARNKKADPKCDPARFNYTWTWWQDK